VLGVSSAYSAVKGFLNPLLKSENLKSQSKISKLLTAECAEAWPEYAEKPDAGELNSDVNQT
jgi:hypothetical protein